MNWTLIAPLLVLLTNPAWAVSWEWEADSVASKVEFLAIGNPSALKIRGKAEGLMGKAQVDEAGKASGELLVDLTSLDTGIKLRNQHMKEKYLEVEKYPKAKLELRKLDLAGMRLEKKVVIEGVPFTGSLEVHGKKSDVAGVVKLERTGDKLSVDAEFELKIEDFGIEQPSFMSIKMAREVKVSVRGVGTVKDK